LTSTEFVVKQVDTEVFQVELVKNPGEFTSIRNVTYATAGLLSREVGEIVKAPGMGTPT